MLLLFWCGKLGHGLRLLDVKWANGNSSLYLCCIDISMYRLCSSNASPAPASSQNTVEFSCSILLSDGMEHHGRL
jgi:hypothetical protein